MRCFILMILFACTGTGTGTGTDDTGPTLIEQTTSYGDCPATTTGQSATWQQLEALHYVELETGVHVFTSEKEWSEDLPHLSASKVGIDFKTQSVVLGSWSGGGCDFPTGEIRSTHSDGATTSVGISVDARVDPSCDMGTMITIGAAVPKAERVVGCMEVKTLVSEHW